MFAQMGCELRIFKHHRPEEKSRVDQIGTEEATETHSIIASWEEARNDFSPAKITQVLHLNPQEMLATHKMYNLLIHIVMLLQLLEIQ